MGMESWKETLGKTPKWKLGLALLGVGYLVVLGVWAVNAAMTHEPRQGASDLAANPDRQEEILAQRGASAMKKSLGLSPEQTEAVAALLEETMRNRQAARAEAGAGGPRAMMEAMRAMQMDTRAKLDGILSPEQRAKLDSLSPAAQKAILGPAMGPPMPGMMRGGRGPGGRGFEGGGRGPGGFGPPRPGEGGSWPSPPPGQGMPE